MPATDNNTGTLNQDDLISRIMDSYSDPKLGRVFSLMGPNGAGKSRLLTRLDKIFTDRIVPHLLLPPYRTVSGGPLQGPSPNIDRFSSPDLPTILQEIMNILMSYSFLPGANRQHGSLTALHTLIGYCQSVDGANESRFAIEAATWIRNHKRGEEPQPPSSTLVSIILEKLSNIIGYHVELRTRQDGSPFTFTDMGRSFGAQSLSDGEKQILLISIFLTISTIKHFILLVDEPELYLNEARAIEIWDRIEANFPEAVFVHATHNVGFATRPTTTGTFLLRFDGALEPINLEKPIASSVMRTMIGTRIQLLRVESPVIFCEDEIHRMLYSDLFGTKVYLQAVGGCGNVISAVTREDAWEHLRSEGPSFCGIIDMDERAEDDIRKLEDRKVFCFPYYEVESALLVPQIALPCFKVATNKDIPLEEFARLLATAARYCMRQALQEAAEFISRRQYGDIKFDYDDVNGVTNIHVQAEQMADKFRTRAADMLKAINSNNVDEILRLFPGKLLYHSVIVEFSKNNKRAKEKPFKEPLQAYRVMRRDPEFVKEIREIPSMVDLRLRVKAALND